MATSIQPQQTTPEADALLSPTKPKTTQQTTTPPLPGVSAAVPFTGGLVNSTASAPASPAPSTSTPAPSSSTTTASPTPSTTTAAPTTPATTPPLPGVQAVTTSANTTAPGPNPSIGQPVSSVAPSTPKWAYQDGRYSVEGGSSGFSPEMAGRIFLDDGTEATAGNLPPGYLLTPEAVQRMKDGFAVNLTKGGGAQYIATDAATNALRNGVGGRGTADGGFQAYDQNNRPSLNPVSPEAIAAAAQRAGQWTGASSDQLSDYNRNAVLQSLIQQGASPAQLQEAGYDPSLSTYVAPPSNPDDQIQFPRNGAPPAPSGPMPGPVLPPPAGSPPPAPTPPGSIPAPPPAPPAPGSPPPETVAPRTSMSPPLPGVSAPGTSPSLTPYTADDNLIDKTISRAPGADRFKLAQDQWDAFQKSTNPAYEAELRDANRMAAAGGALGSGGLQEHIGDLASNRATQLDAQRTNLLSKALEDAINDSFGDASLAIGQQGFQAGRSDTAFNQGVQQTQLEEALRSGDFSRALAALTAGSSGNPADIDMALSKIFGDQSSAAGAALAELIKNTTANRTGSTSANNTNALVQSLINALRPGGSSSSTPPINTGVNTIPGTAEG